MYKRPAAVEALLKTAQEDKGPWIDMGEKFKCNGVAWTGKACVSSKALYLLKENQTRQGAGVSRLLSMAMERDDGLRSCLLRDAPHMLRAMLDLSGTRADKELIIIPRTSASRVESSPFYNAIWIVCGDNAFKVWTNPLAMFSIPKEMAKLGWAMNSPKEKSDGVSAERPSGKAYWQRTLWERIGLIAAFLLVVFIVSQLRWIFHKG